MRKTIYDLNPDYMLDLNQEYMLKHEIFLEDKNPIRYIADHYGYEAQSRQLIEEMAELTQAINKMWRIDASNREKMTSDRVEAYRHIIEEVADVEICLEQVKWLLNIDESVLDEWKVMKIERSIDRMSSKESETEWKNKILNKLLKKE